MDYIGKCIRYKMAGRFIQGAMVGFEPWNKQIANVPLRWVVMQKVTKPRITYRFPYKSKIELVGFFNFDIISITFKAAKIPSPVFEYSDKII